MKQTLAVSPMPEAGMIDMTRTMPPEIPAIAPILKRALEHVSKSSSLLEVVQRHHYFGTERERRVASDWLRDRLGYTPDPSQIFITGGTQNTLQILLPRLCEVDGAIATEALSYAGITQIARLYGRRIIGLDIDDNGIIPEAFRAACNTQNVKVLYCNPTIHNPTTSVLPLERRLELTKIAREFGVSIIEDDVHGKLVRGAPQPIAGIAPDISWYLLSVSKCLGMGLRCAFLIGPSSKSLDILREPVQSISSWFVPGISSELVTFLIEIGAADDVADLIRQEVETRQQIAAHAFSRFTTTTNPNSLHLWLTLPADLTVSELITTARLSNILLRSSNIFSVDGRDIDNSIRLSLVAPRTREDLSYAVNHIAQILGRF